MNEKELRSYLKENGTAKVYIFQKGGYNVIAKTVFRLGDIKSKHFFKTIEYYKTYHGELKFKLEA